MDRIWAPWRKAYTQSRRVAPKGCLFCRLAKSRQDASDFILKRTDLSYAVLNIYPYTNGHVMVVPNRHVDRIDKLTAKEQLDWLALLSKIQRALQKKLTPHGFNLGLNIGKPAGAGIPKHLHFHIVPRWTGDVNFMPTIAGAKLISESLEAVYASLKPVLR
jgi:ATP adenylyltransferase